MRRTLAITGANGNLGSKIAHHFLRRTGVSPVEWHVKLLDDYQGFCKGNENPPTPSRPSEPAGTFEYLSGDEATGTFELVTADTRRMDSGWVDALEGVDAVVHLAAWNPYPEASWLDSEWSMDMTANLIQAAAKHNVPRVVHISSNHVFGKCWREGYTLDEAGVIAVGTPPNVGTDFKIPEFNCDATPYAAAKLAGESMLRAACAGGSINSGVCIRLGWCQPGENLPSSMSVLGTPTIPGGAPGQATAALEEGFDDQERLLGWFQHMWISNRDMLQLVERSCEPLTKQGKAFEIVYGMSRNRNMRWDISNSIGYAPVDDVCEHLS